MTSFDAEIRGHASSFWSLGVPIFFHVYLDRGLQDAPVYTKNEKFRLLMVTATDGDESVVVSSSLLMVGFVTRLTLNDFYFVMQAASMCPFLMRNLQSVCNLLSHGLSFYNNNSVSVYWIVAWKMVMISDGGGTASLFGFCELPLVLSTLRPLLF